MEEERQSNKPHSDNLGRRVANSVFSSFTSSTCLKVHGAILQNSQPLSSSLVPATAARSAAEVRTLQTALGSLFDPPPLA